MHIPKVLRQTLTDKLTDQTRHFKGKKSHRMKPCGTLVPKRTGTQRLLPAQGSAASESQPRALGMGLQGRHDQLLHSPCSSTPRG